ncbi:UNVERIFIED_CONTAM: hypothetical protein FKN15_071541 [Acipenser sinensis]
MSSGCKSPSRPVRALSSEREALDGLARQLISWVGKSVSLEKDKTPVQEHIDPEGKRGSSCRQSQL